MAFLTIIDYILIYVRIIFGFVVYQSWSTAMWSLLTLPILGPAAVIIAADRLELSASEKILEKAKMA